MLPAGGLGKVVIYKGSPEGNPSGGGLGVSPIFKKPPRLGDTEDLILCHSELVSESQDCPGEQ